MANRRMANLQDESRRTCKTGITNKQSTSSSLLTCAALLPTPYSLLPTAYCLLLTPLLGYILVSLIATWPLVTHLRGWVPGFGDWGQNLWALWWTRHALLVLAQHPFFTNYLFYPEGVTLLFHPLDVSDGLLAIPLYGLLGGDVTYNLVVLLSFVLGGWGTYLLALYLTGHRAASFVAGLIFVLSPYHFLRIDLGHLNLSTLQWIPFYTLFLLKFVQQGSRRSAALAVFFLAFNALNSWYYVIYCGLLTLAVLFWPGGNQRTHTQKTGTGRVSVCEPANERMSESANDEPPVSNLHSPFTIHHSPFIIHHWFIRAGRIGLVLLVTVLLLSPLLVPMFRLLGTTTLVGEHNPLRHSVDLFSFWLPGPPSTWAGWFEDVWISYAAHNREPGASAYLGYTVLGLSVMGLLGRRWRRQAIWWFAVALGFTLLALGPQLQIDGQVFDVVLPYQLLSNFIPAFSITGIPGRFVVMISLALAMLSAYGLATLTQWLLRDGVISSAVSGRRSAVGLWLCLVVGLLISLEYLAIPLRLTRTEVAEFYHIAASDTERYAMVDIKWDANFLMHAQTVHGKPLVGGWLARLPESQATYLNQSSLDKAFLYLLLGPAGAELSDPPAIQQAIHQALLERNVRYIIDHDYTAGPWLEQFVDWPVVYQEEGMVVYEGVRPQPD